MKTSKKFNDDVREVISQYHKAQEELDDAYDTMLEKLQVEEEARLPELWMAPVGVGARVWSSNYKRYGTVTEVKSCVGILTDDYYGDRAGSGRYAMPDEEYGEEYGVYPSVDWRFTVQVDPSPVRGESPEPREVMELTMERDGKWMRYGWGDKWEETQKPKHA
jgi:hypothetical protein